MTSPDPAPGPARPAAEGVARIGMVISGRYLIKALLGEGGMGSVYLAEHTGMKKRVALKLLHPEMIDNAEVSARFEREAMAAAHIEHPNVAGATDFGKTEDGSFFLVLEYVEGTNLRDVIEEGPLSATRAVRITRQIALALERAHDAGIVHRDLKPENVMLVKREVEPDFVKVLDFGIAKVLEGAANVSAEIAKRNAGIGKPNEPLTRLGTILGTPEYMAPEQALGEPVTPAADLYGVGVMLYEMLTGKHPFEPPDRTAMLSFHIVAPVPMMEDRAPAVDVPPAVEAVARCLLEKDSKKRYANARALVDALDAAAAASGIDAGGAPSAIPSHPGEAPARGAGWGDAGAARAIGAPDGNMTTHAVAPTALFDAFETPPPASVRVNVEGPGGSAGAGAGAGARTTGAGAGLVSRLGGQPRSVLFLLAAGVPLLFVVLVVVAVLVLRKPTSRTGQTFGNEAGAQNEKTKSAPADRVAAAVALGPDALESLAKEFPDDSSLLKKLAIADQAQGKSSDALRNVRALVAVDPTSVNDEEIGQLVETIAAKGQGEDDNDAFAVLEGPFGARGVDILIEMTAKGQGREVQLLRARAQKSLAKPEVRAHASPGAAVLLDFKAAQTCQAKHELLGRVKEHGDTRIVPPLKGVKAATRGCGFLGRGDCWGCMRRDGMLEEAIGAAESRSGAPTPAASAGGSGAPGAPTEQK